MAATLIYPRAYPSRLEKFRQCYGRQPYTYYIGWFEYNVWYYGLRYSKKAGLIPENDLWINYFTSCNKVKEYRDLYGEPDYIVIHKTFNTIFEAQEYETNTLEEFKASGYWDYFINKTTNKSIDPASCALTGQKMKNISKSKEHRQKISEINTGKILTEETKQKIGKSVSGKNNGFYGRNHSIAAKEKQREKSEKQPVYINGIYFSSLTQASEHFSVTKQAISYWAKTGKNNTFLV